MTDRHIWIPDRLYVLNSIINRSQNLSVQSTMAYCVWLSYLISYMILGVGVHGMGWGLFVQVVEL